MKEPKFLLLTENTIRQLTTEQSYERGKAYYERGAVRNRSRLGRQLRAQVEGAQFEPYSVFVTLDEAGVASASCTCPYTFGGYCKHVVAVLLAFSDSPATFIPEPDLEDVLASLSEKQLRERVRALIEDKPALIDWFRPTNEQPAPPQPAPKRKTAVDTAAYRREIRRALDQIDYRRHWQTIWDVVHALDKLHAQAQAFLAGGDFRNALRLMETFAEEVLPQYGEVEEESQLYESLSVWVEDFTEAILGTHLNDEERAALLTKVEGWSEYLDDYGLGDLLDMPTAACVRGWDEGADYGVDLTELQLNVLATQQDNDAYLHRCKEQGAHYRYAERLIELGRIVDAIDYALSHTLSADDSLKLSKLLRAQGEVKAAYDIAHKGLTHERTYALAEWVATLAEALGALEEAQQAWFMAFEERPSVEGYRQLKRLSDENWGEMHAEMMTRIEDVVPISTRIEIILEEGNIERAMQIWERDPGRYPTLEKLVDAVAGDHPDWAIRHIRSQVERWINKASKYYPRVIDWLLKAKRIYLQHDRSQEWQQLLADIRTRYNRKYSLMAQIEERLVE